MATSSDTTQSDPLPGGDAPRSGEGTTMARSGDAHPGTRSAPAAGARVPARAERRPPLAGNGRPGTPAEMRQEIERTRARMTATLDALEAKIEDRQARIQRQKQKVVDGITLKGVRTKLSREPWRTLAIAFAAGYIIAAIRD